MDFDLEDDFDFDDEFGDLMPGDMTEPPPPKDTREAISRAVTNAGTSFKETFTDDVNGLAKEMIMKTVPAGISSEVDELTTGVDNFKEELKDSIKTARTQVKSGLGLMARAFPNSDAAQKVTSKISGWLGSDDEEYSSSESGPSKEELQRQEIMGKLIQTMGEDTLADKQQAFIKDSLEANRHYDIKKLTQIIASNSDLSAKFDLEVTNRFYRKSLELQYKSLYISKEQLGLYKVFAENNKNQLEAIIANTALPDIVKTRKSEEVMANIRTRMNDNLVDSIKSNLNKGWMGQASNRVKEMMDNATGTLTDMVGMGEGMLDQKESMAGMGPNRGLGGFAGDAIADFTKTKIGKALNKKVASNDKVKNFVYKGKNLMTDPSEALAEASVNASNPIISGLLDKISDITKVKTDDDKIKSSSLNEMNRNEAQIFDGRAHTSLTKVIPGLLGKLYGVVKAIHDKDSKPEDNELHYDDRTDTFKTTADVKEDIKNIVSRATENISKPVLDQIIDLLKEEGELDVKDKKSNSNLYSGLMSYAYSEGSIAPDKLNKKLPDMFDKNLGKKVSRSISTILTKAKEEPELLDKLRDGFKELKEARPSMAGLVEEYGGDSRLNVLKESNILKTDKDGNVSLDKKGSERYVTDLVRRSKYTDKETRIQESIDNKDKEDKSKFEEYIDGKKESIASVKNNFKATVKDKANVLTDNIITGTGDKITHIKDGISNINNKFTDNSKVSNKETSNRFVKTNNSTENDFSKYRFSSSNDDNRVSNFKDTNNISKMVTDKLTSSKEFVTNNKYVKDVSKSVSDTKTAISDKVKEVEVPKTFTKDMITNAVSNIKDAKVIKSISKEMNSITKTADSLMYLPGMTKEEALASAITMHTKDKIDKSEFIDSIKASVKKTDKSKEVSENTVQGKLSKVITLLEKVKPKKKEADKNVFDRDGSGQRDGSWQEILKKNKDKKIADAKAKAEKLKNKITGKDKESKSDSMLGTLLSMIGGKGGVLGMLGSLPGLFASGLTGLLPGALSLGLRGITGILKGGFSLLGKLLGPLGGMLGKALGIGGKTAAKTVATKTATEATKRATTKATSQAVGKTVAKSTVTKAGGKVGLKAAGKLAGKLASRAVPVLGWGLAAWDAGNIAYDMISNGTSFKSATSKQMLGTDITDDANKVDPVKEDSEDSYIQDELNKEDKDVATLSKDSLNTVDNKTTNFSKINDTVKTNTNSVNNINGFNPKEEIPKIKTKRSLGDITGTMIAKSNVDSVKSNKETQILGANGNKILEAIAGTMVSSLAVQEKMLEQLNGINQSNSDIVSKIDVEKKDVPANQVKNKPVTERTNFPTMPVDLARKAY